MTSIVASLVLLATVLSATSATNDELLACSRPDTVTVQLSDKRNVVVYGTELLIRNASNVSFYAYPGMNTVNAVFHDIDIQFRGYMRDETADDNTVVDIISWRNKGLVLGFVKLGESNGEEYSLLGVHLDLSANSDYSSNVPLEVVHEIQRSAESCLKANLCATIQTVKVSELKEISRVDELGPHAVLIRPLREIFNSEDQCIADVPNESDLFGKININELVDTAVAIVVDGIKESHQEEIKLNDIQKSFKAGNKIVRIKGKFEASGGTFKDLSTLRRTANAVLANQGHRYTAECGFGLQTARAHFNHYKLKVGPARVSGHITIDVSGLAVAAKVAVDYNQTPCTSQIEYVKITNIGKLNIKISGLGPLNHMMSKLLTWVTSRYKDNIVRSVEKTLSSVAQKQFERSFKCEKFRP